MAALPTAMSQFNPPGLAGTPSPLSFMTPPPTADFFANRLASMVNQKANSSGGIVSNRIAAASPRPNGIGIGAGGPGANWGLT